MRSPTPSFSDHRVEKGEGEERDFCREREEIERFPIADSVHTLFRPIAKADGLAHPYQTGRGEEGGGKKGSRKGEKGRVKENSSKTIN